MALEMKKGSITCENCYDNILPAQAHPWQLLDFVNFFSFQPNYGICHQADLPSTS
jgi:hypothetical protein